MNESVAVTKEADAKKGFSSTHRSEEGIHLVRDEREGQFGSLRDVTDNIRHDGGTPSAESIATELSSMHTAQRASVLLALQQTHGNRYVQRVVSGIQAKLAIGKPGDRYEQEADRVAEEVMRMPEPEMHWQAEEEEEEQIQTKPLAEQITPLVQRQVEEDEEEILQTSREEDVTPEVTQDLESHIQAIQGGGQPLPESVRAYFEPRFGYDFSQVRVHSDAQAAESTRAVNARAFTVGRDVMFGAGQYTPGTSEGQRLLAHELAHVVQQHNSKNPYMARYIDAWAPVMKQAEESQRRPPPASDPTSPIEVTVIDGKGMAGWLAGFFRTGEVYMTNVTTMVENVLQTLDKHRILRLNILDHGNQNGIQIGNDWITTKSIAKHHKVLARLRGRFAANGFVHVQHCNAGQNLDLIRALAATFGVPVYAGTGAHSAVYRFNLGDYVRCDSKGKCKTKVGRP